MKRLILTAILLLVATAAQAQWLPGWMGVDSSEKIHSTLQTPISSIATPPFKVKVATGEGHYFASAMSWLNKPIVVTLAPAPGYETASSLIEEVMVTAVVGDSLTISRRGLSNPGPHAWLVGNYIGIRLTFLHLKQIIDSLNVRFRQIDTIAGLVASAGLGLPSQTGNNGKVLTTNGSAASWGTFPASVVPVTLGGTGLNSLASGKMLYASALNTVNALTPGTGLTITGGALNVTMSSFTTDNLAQGATNKYYTDAQVWSAITATSPIHIASGNISVGLASSVDTGLVKPSKYNEWDAKQNALTLPLPIAQGGTGAATRETALNALLPDSTSKPDTSVLGKTHNGFEWVTIAGSGGGSGTMTSVTVTVPSILSVTPATITTSGTFAVTLATETANKIFAGPTTGSPATPTFRDMVAADIPNSIVTNAKLQNSSVTVTAGSGLSGGGSVALGGSVTLTNAGVTSAIAGTGISVDAATGPVTITNAGVISITGTANQVIASAATGAITLSTPQNIGTGSSPTFAAMTLANTTNQLVLGTTNTSTITSVAPSASRVYTIVDAGADASFVTTQGNITISGSKTFSSPIVGSVTGNSGTVTNGVYTLGNQTIAGNKTFSGTTNLSALTASGALTLNSSKNIVSTALTNGQLIVGSTGADPVAAAITAGSGISVTSGAGTITIAATAGISNPMTTTGDIIVSADNSGTAARLGVGAATDVLHGGTTPGYSQIVNGDITNATIDLTTKVTGTLAVGNGGIGVATLASNGVLYGNSTSAVLALAVNSTGTNKFLTQSSSNAPAWTALASGDIPNNAANTTGSSAKWTTARNLAGNSVDGSANVAFANAFIVQGTADAGLSGAQFLGALATGIVKNTTSTGVLSIAVAGDFPTLNQNTTGTASNVTGTVVVANGGTGQTTLTNHGLLVGAGTSAITQLSSATNGQIPIGSTGADPVLAAITAGSGISVTNGAGTITIATTGSSMTNPMTTTGDIIQSSDNSGTPARLAVGSANQVLGVSSGLASWQTLGVDATLVGNGRGTSFGIDLTHANTWTGIQEIDKNGIAATSTDAIVLKNATDATVGTTAQLSPRERWTGSAWKSTATAAAQYHDWIAECQPVTGTTTTNSNWVLSSQNNGGGYVAQITWNSGSGPLVVNGSSEVLWGNNTTQITDMYLGSGKTWTLNSAGMTMKIHPPNGSGTNVTGSSLQMSLGLGTGNAIGGSAIWSSSFTGSSGSTAASATEIGRLAPSGALASAVSTLTVGLAGSVTGKIVFPNNTNSNTYTITSAAPAASRTLTIPDPLAAANFVFDALANTFTTAQTIKTDAIATTFTNGLVLSNTTASTSGVPVQQSPSLVLNANVWNTTATAADSLASIRITNVPASSSSTYAQLQIDAGNTAGGWTNYLTIYPNGGAFTTDRIFTVGARTTGVGNGIIWQGGTATGTDHGGGSLYLQAGPGTGSGSPSSVLIKTPAAGSTGTTVQTLKTIGTFGFGNINSTSAEFSIGTGSTSTAYIRLFNSTNGSVCTITPVAFSSSRTLTFQDPGAAADFLLETAALNSAYAVLATGTQGVLSDAKSTTAKFGANITFDAGARTISIADASSANGSALTTQSQNGNGTDKTGGNIDFIAGKGTGTGRGGLVEFISTFPASTGSSLNTIKNMLVITPTGTVGSTAIATATLGQTSSAAGVLELANASNSNTIQIAAAAPTSVTRVITFQDPGANADVVTTAGAQSIAGNKTFTGTTTMSGALTFGAGENLFVGGAQPANYTTLATDMVLPIDCTGGAVTVTLTASPSTGQHLYIYKSDATGNAVTISGNTGQSIGGVSGTLTTQYAVRELIYVGTNIWLAK